MRHDYRCLVSSIAHLPLSTRPDLAFSAYLFSQFLSNPGFSHWQAAKHVLRYHRGTTDVGTTFMKCDDTGLNGYTKSYYASCKDDRRSITGFCFNVGSGAISNTNFFKTNKTSRGRGRGRDFGRVLFLPSLVERLT